MRIFLLLLTIINIKNVASQQYSKIDFTTKIVDTFTFQKNWEYPEGIYKDDITGKFENIYGGKAQKKDTVHRFYTAQCSTNVQGGYAINFADAYHTKDSFLVIRIQDGLPAYASHYDIFIRNDSFYFKPKTIYPIFRRGEKISHKITIQKLTIDTNTTKNRLLARIDMRFEEIVTIPNKEPHINNFFLKGVIRTLIKNSKFRSQDFLNL